MSREDRKRIAHHLDTAAARADIVDREPATEKQCWFLAGLLLDTGRDADYLDCGPLNSGAILTKRDASRYIDALLAEKNAAAAA